MRPIHIYFAVSADAYPEKRLVWVQLQEREFAPILKIDDFENLKVITEIHLNIQIANFPKIK